MNKREVGKTEKYKVLKDEIARMSVLEEVIVIPAVAGALGAISSGFEKHIAVTGIDMRIEHAQKKSFIEGSKDFDTGTWILKEKIISL